MSKFEETFEQLRMEQEDLDERMDKIRKEAVAHIQAIVDQFGLKSSDIRFYDSTESAVAKKPRKSSAPKYRLPTGAEWTGKGIMKKEFKEYFEENGLTKEDLEQFRI